MIRILFDHQTFSLQRYGGISRYFYNIYRVQNDHTTFKADISLLYSRNYYTKDIKAPLNNFLGKLFLDDQKKNYKWNKKYSKFCISRNNFDVLHPTYYEPYFLKKLKKPYVITVHDMIHELMPECFDSKDIDAQNKKICIENANHIIAISETTKRDLINILGVDENKISVIYHGYFENKLAEDLILPNKNGQYLLFVGERGTYKNFSNFLRAAQQLLLKNKDLKVICAGGGQFKNDENALFKALNISQQINQESVTDIELTTLYKNAMAFIFPSLYEGFGLPILEAFNAECPIILSNTDCFKEIAADAAVYFNPLDADDIAEKIESVINNQLLRKELASKGLNRLEYFSMEKCINKTLAVYKLIG